jgi:hypothetical protein
VLTVIVTIITIMGSSICSVNSYCDNKVEVYMQCLTCIMTIVGRSMGSANSYCDKNGEFSMQC